jgi:hypothetical protein
MPIPRNWNDSVIVVVAGMHRSGTSMVAGLLHRSGVSMGSDFRRAQRENPKGFFEEEAFRSFNDRLLRRVGYVVKEWDPEFPGIRPSSKDQSDAVALIRRFNRASDIWGWKDPRTCLTLGFWLKAIAAAKLSRDTNVIVIKRNVRSVSRSLRARGNVDSMSKGGALCRMYNTQLEEYLLEHEGTVRVCRISYEGLVRGMDVNRLESFCGLKLDTDFIDPDLDHSRPHEPSTG